jgi:hypothetical protein
MSEESDPKDVASFRFKVVGEKFRMHVVYRGIQMNVFWLMAVDGSDHADMGDLIEALPDAWKSIHTEIDIQSEVAGLEGELEEFLKGGDVD